MVNWSVRLVRPLGIGARVGSSVRKALWAAFWGDPIRPHRAEASQGDISDADMRQAIRDGIPLGDYIKARLAGASHHHILQAHEQTSGLLAYASALKAGRSHRQALDDFSV